MTSVSPPGTSERPKPSLGWGVISTQSLRHPPELFASFVYFVVGLTILALAVATVLLLHRLLVGVATAQPDDINKLILALAALIAGPFAIWRVVIAAQQTRILRETHYTTLFTKAVEQLGATKEVKRTTARRNGYKPGLGAEAVSSVATVPNSEVRLGAVYALERVAQDSERDHWPIMETLCAFVRNNSVRADGLSEAALSILARNRTDPARQAQMQGELSDIKRAIQQPHSEVLAALVVIGRRPEARRQHEEVRRAASQDNYSYRLDLFASNLARARLDGLHLAYAILDEADLTFSSLRRSCMKRTWLSGARLDGANLAFGTFDGSRLSGAQLSGALLSNGSFLGAQMTGANLRGAFCANTDFSSANLALADLRFASLPTANFTDATLWGAQLQDCDLTDVQFSGARLANAILTDAWLGGADLSQVIGLEAQQLIDTHGTAETKIPANVPRPAKWDAPARGRRARWSAERSRKDDPK